ncbi:MAG: hypothetical protein ACRBHB_17190 [Arenicella sp.]
MKLAKASDQDLNQLWSVYRCLEKLEYCNTEHTEKRLEKLIIARLEKLGPGGLVRVVMGLDTLINNCCDPDLNYYEFKPEIVQALKQFKGSE